MPKKLIRITTIPMYLAYNLRGQPSFMQQNGMDVIMISADGKDLPTLLANEICPHIIVPMTRSITPWQDIKCLFKLIKIFKKEKPDIVHTETPKAGLLGMLASRFCNVKIRINTVAGLPLMVEKGLKLWVLQWIEKITYAAATNVWPNSHSILNYIIQHKFTYADKLRVVGRGSSNGTNTHRFNRNNLDPEILKEIKSSFNYNPRDIYFLFIGRIVFDKGIVELVNVFSALQKNYTGLKLILKGEYEASLDPLPETTISKINNNSSITHVGWSDKVEYYMSLADYFVFPSHREGFPTVLLEAGAIQLSIICSGIAGNIDIVTHHETGLIFENMNEQDLYEKLEYALSNRQQMQSMASALQEIIKTGYEQEMYWEELLSEYRKLIDKADRS